VPPLVATDGPRVLLEEVPGRDQYAAPVRLLVRMVAMLVGLQAGWVSRVGELERLGVPDWRPGPLASAAAHSLSAAAEQLDAATARRVDALIAGLAGRFARVAEAGVPDTLVHGDFHAGNVCGTEDRLVLLDWGDCGIGHPMLDQAAFLERLDGADTEQVQRVWAGEWRAAVPGCDPDGAAALLAPVAALRQAVIYQTFLDGIEPDERVYHEGDPASWLRRAAELATES
jgi:Ser/Thr protein kinase RdoA (MazF antagonist)